MFSWSKKYNNGYWTSEEHSQFIQCIKTHGIEWPMLKKSIPTRTRLQIKSHLRRYFHQIRKHFGLEDPMEYIMNNDCDHLRFYKNDILEDKTKYSKKSSRASEKPETNPKKMMSQRSESKTTGELFSSCNSKFEEQKHFRKRDLKHSRKVLEDSQVPSLETPLIPEREFSIEKINQKKIQRNGEFSKFQRPMKEHIKAASEKFIQRGLISNKLNKNCDLPVNQLRNANILEARIQTTVPCEIIMNHEGNVKIYPQQGGKVILESTMDNRAEATHLNKCFSAHRNIDAYNPLTPTTPNIWNKDPHRDFIQNEDYSVITKAIELLTPYFCFCE
ncbi:unnamed protein product [Moneuplotes crassus]|uniref:Uncharacterized protein n=1 Tax=Euplotes crassus TaxID=5936 RepID=A0AAD1UB51_EUPCR|nr:unnamed protein product [Moneuplotes crassus]